MFTFIHVYIYILTHHYFIYIDFEKLPPKVRSSVEQLEKATAECTGFLVNICLSYGSRAEIVMACNAAIAENQKQQNIDHGIQESSMNLMQSNYKKCGKDVVKNCKKSCKNDKVKGDENEDIKDGEAYDSLSEESNAFTIDATDIDDDSFDSVQEVDSESLMIDRNVSTENNRSDSNLNEIDRENCQCQGSSSISNIGSIHQAISDLDINNSCMTKNIPKNDRKSFTIDEDTLSRHMCTVDIPDPDILIRTSGEYRISNFLLWQMAYTEMFFVDKYWPEITHQDLRAVLQQFHDRQRRFGV